MIKADIICKRCGLCCILKFEGKTKKCRNMIFIGNKSICRIYNSKTRVGTMMGKLEGQKFYCNDRQEVKMNYPGCPYNREEWNYDEADK